MTRWRECAEGQTWQEADTFSGKLTSRKRSGAEVLAAQVEIAWGRKQKRRQAPVARGHKDNLKKTYLMLKNVNVCMKAYWKQIHTCIYLYQNVHSHAATLVIDIKR